MDHTEIDPGTVSPVAAEAATEKPRAGTPDVTRRRLMLGAGALIPSVYTLTSGATTAAASTTACFSKSTTYSPNRFVDNQDKWYRAPVYEGKTSGNTAHCVTTPQNSCSDGNGGGQTGSVWIKKDGSRMVAGPGSNVSNVPGRPKSYGLVYVDQQGTVSTLDPNGNTNLSWASIACWNSIMGSRISKLN